MFNKKKSAMPNLGQGSQTPFAEAYKALRTNLDYYATTEDVHTILFVAPEADADKCMFVRNLAMTLAGTGKSVLLADFDLRDGTLSKMQDAAAHTGVSEVLNGQAPAADAIISETRGGVDFLPSGTTCADPAALFSHKETAALLRALRSQYDFVLLDAPCADAYTDAIVLSRIADAAVLLTAAGTTHLPAAEACKQKLADVNAKLLGAVLTNYDPKSL